MVETELTYNQESRYHGYMEPSADTSRSESSRNSAPESAPSPQENEGDIEPQEVSNYEANWRAEKSQELTNPNRLTREFLGKMIDDLRKPKSPSQVYGAAEQVLYAAKVLQKNAKNLPSQNKDKIDFDKIVEAAQQLVDRIRQDGRIKDVTGDYEIQKAAGERMATTIFSKAGEIASLASHVKDFYEREKIAPEERDPYKPIQSFEELMTKWVDVVEDKFRPGGEFALIDVEEYTDEFGRVLLKETAHPENFQRWVREKIWFYHDFDPYKPINLFQNLYLTVGFRTVQVYEMLVDVPTYFYHREETLGDLQVGLDTLQRASNKKRFVFSEAFAKEINQEKPNLDKVSIAGYYRFKSESTGQEVDYQVRFAGRDPRTGQLKFDVFEKDKNGDYTLPVQAVLEDKDKWQAGKNTGFETIKEDLLYEVWVLNEAHNHDVAYRMNGMPTETELKKVMGEIYGMNMYTKNRERLLRILKMKTTTRREDGIEELQAHMEGKLDGQGSIGKAIQRSLMAWYHTGEANASANGYKIEGPNPFKEALKKGDIDGADIFYKSLIRQTLEGEFGEKIPEVAQELLSELNKGRKDFQKADLVDILLLDRQSLLVELQKRGFSEAKFRDAVDRLREKYQGDSQKTAELQRLLTSSTLDKKQHLFNSLIGYKQYGVTKEWLSGKTQKEASAREGFENFMTKPGLEGIDAFAVKFFGLAYDSWGTPDANVYVNINYSLQARDRVRQAMRDVLQQTEKLDTFEAKYAEEWAFTFTYFTGISARNDLQGIGHDAWSKIINTEFYRLRQSSGGNYYGNLDNLYGIHRLGVDFWQGLIVQEEGSGKLNRTLYEILVGLEKEGDGTYSFNINREIKNFDFHGNAMRQFNADHVGHVIDLFEDITKKHEFNLDKLLAEDNMGRLRWNHEEMQKMIDSTWKHLRYGFDNRNFLYDNPNFGWWYDEKMNADGSVSRTPHFGLKTIRQLMFSEKVRSMHMYERDDVSSWKHGSERTKMGRNVFAYLIAAQLQEHVHNPGYRYYSADEVATITEAFLMYAARIMKGEDASAIFLSGFFSPEEIMRILIAGHAVLWTMYLKEYTGSAAGGFLAGLFEAFALIMKQAGAGIKL